MSSLCSMTSSCVNFWNYKLMQTPCPISQGSTETHFTTMRIHALQFFTLKNYVFFCTCTKEQQYLFSFTPHQEMYSCPQISYINDYHGWLHSAAFHILREVLFWSYTFHTCVTQRDNLLWWRIKSLLFILCRPDVITLIANAHQFQGKRLLFVQ